MLAQTQKNPLIVWLGRVHSCWLLPDHPWRSPTSPWWCCWRCMLSSSVSLPPAALLLWADSLPYCTGLLYRPAMLKTSQILARQNTVSASTWNFLIFFSKLQQVVKTKSDLHHCPISKMSCQKNSTRGHVRFNLRISNLSDEHVKSVISIYRQLDLAVAGSSAAPAQVLASFHH